MLHRFKKFTMKAKASERQKIYQHLVQKEAYLGFSFTFSEIFSIWTLFCIGMTSLAWAIEIIPSSVQNLPMAPFFYMTSYKLVLFTSIPFLVVFLIGKSNYKFKISPLDGVWLSVSGFCLFSNSSGAPFKSY